MSIDRGVAPLGLFLSLSLLLTGTANAQSLGADALKSFPKNVSELAYVDLKQARSEPWLAQFKLQTLPVAYMQIEAFLSAAGVNYDAQVTGVVWAAGSPQGDATEAQAKTTAASNEFAGMIMGDFSLDEIGAALDQKQLETSEMAGETAYPCGPNRSDLYIALIDSNTIAFGQPEMLQRLLEVRSGAAQGLFLNDTLLPLVRQVDGDGMFWAVSSGPSVREAVSRLLPGAADFPVAAGMLRNLKAMTVTISGEDEINATIAIKTQSSSDAVVLSQVMQIGLLAREHQERDSNSDLAPMIGAVRVGAAGDDVDSSFTLTNQQVLSLVEHDIFHPL